MLWGFCERRGLIFFVGDGSGFEVFVDDDDDDFCDGELVLVLEKKREIEVLFLGYDIVYRD